MTFNNETIIEPYLENISSIPNQHVEFIPIERIQTMESNSFIGLWESILIDEFSLSWWTFYSDVLGMIITINDLVHGRSKQNKDYTKRDILILDQTGQITVTLWYQMVSNIFHWIKKKNNGFSGREFSNITHSNIDHVKRCLYQWFQRR